MFKIWRLSGLGLPRNLSCLKREDLIEVDLNNFHSYELNQYT